MTLGALSYLKFVMSLKAAPDRVLLPFLEHLALANQSDGTPRIRAQERDVIELVGPTWLIDRKEKTKQEAVLPFPCFAFLRLCSPSACICIAWIVRGICTLHSMHAIINIWRICTEHLENMLIACMHMNE